jgi:16S rRNA (cytidine1402-2'-O)-methyltransferase
VSRGLGDVYKRQKLRREKLEQIEKIDKTIILYEAPHKMKNTLEELSKILDSRKVVLVRELTKIHEEFIREDIHTILEKVDSLKGEMILVIEGNKNTENTNNMLNNLSINDHYEFYQKQGLEKKEIIKKIAKDRNVNKNEIYQMFI